MRPPSSRRSRNGWSSGQLSGVLGGRLLIAVACAAGVTACGVDPSATVAVQPRAGATSTTAQRPETTGTTLVVDGIIVADVGTAVTTRSGNVVTVHEVEWPLDAERPPSADMRYAAADVEACAGDTANRSGIQAAFFHLETSDNTAWPAVAAVREPALPETRLAAGRCARGWVTFLVPTDSDPILVGMQTSTVAAWRVR